MEAETLFDTPGDVEAEALVDTLADTLAEVEAEALGDTLGDFEAEAPVDILADTLAELEAETLGVTLGDVEAEALVDTLADTPAEVESETLGDALGDAEAEALVDTLIVVYGIVVEFLIIVSGFSLFVVLGWNSNVVPRILFVDCPSAIFMNPTVNNPTRLSHENNSEATAERVTEAVKETEISLKK